MASLREASLWATMIMSKALVKSALEGAWDHYRPPVGTAEIARENIIRPGRVYP